jgi:hypothetical protein
VQQGHPKDHDFGCIFPGNKIPYWFSHCKEVSNATLCEIDIDELSHLDWKNTIFAFSAVIGTRDVREEHYFVILAQVSYNYLGYHQIYCNTSFGRLNSSFSDHVWLNYCGSHHSQLKTDNLQVIFTCKDIYGIWQSFKVSVLQKLWIPFRTWISYEEKAIDLIDGDGNLD